MPVLKSDYHYHLPEELIAQHPAEPRDSSRLLLLNRSEGSLQDRSFRDFAELLEPGSLLVVNNSKVIPARLTGQRKTGGQFELLLVDQIDQLRWTAKVKNSARLKLGESLMLCEGNLKAELEEKRPGGECVICFEPSDDLIGSLEQHGYAPLPPYIHKVRKEVVERSRDLKDYQTVYAQSYGSVAAPTAGLHFTPDILEKIAQKEVDIAEITLHVGLGTFEPIRVDDVEHHHMHEERFSIDSSVAEKIHNAKKEGRKIVAVGTTTIRTLESAWQNGELKTGEQKTNLFIYPPYQYQVADQLLTNFHLPESTLLMLVSALAGKDLVMTAYQHAVREKYRFFSFGDCMFIS